MFFLCVCVFFGGGGGGGGVELKIHMFLRFDVSLELQIGL